jgi:LysM repeat protein
VEITSPGGVTMPAQTPSTHTVVEGETLWAIAQQYLGDPMLWPEIYRLNTTVVEDPHWIYPGEELRITPEAPVPGDSSVVVQQSVTVTPTGDTARAAQEPASPVASAMNGPTIFSNQTSQFRRSNTYELASQRAYRAVREGEYFSSGFLTENQPLPSGRILIKTTGLRGEVTAAAQQFAIVMFEAPPGETMQPGDLMLSFRRAPAVGTWGEMIEPTGLLRVKAPTGDKWTAEVVRVYLPVIMGQEVMKVQPFVNSSNQRAQPVTGGIEGHVIRLRNDHTVAQIQNVFFIDKGANDGVRLGDIFQIYGLRVDAERGGSVEQDQGRAIIVSTRAGTSSAVIVELHGGGSWTNSLVRQIRRMPS